MVEFPSEGSLRSWILKVDRDGALLRPYLPHIDDEWFSEMMSCIEITRLIPECRTSLHTAGAILFYKIIKNHRRVDGNKRSALLTMALLYALNGHMIAMTAEEMYEVAERVAKDRGKSGAVETKLEKLLRLNTEPL